MVASFRSDGATIGGSTNGKSRTEISESGMQIYRKINGSDVQIANLGYGKASGESGTSYDTFYTLGTRATTSTAYSSSSTYSIGDLCIYDNDIYVCKENIETAEAWNNSHWQLYVGSRSVAEGYDATSAGAGAHAEGYSVYGGNVIAIGLGAHAEGMAQNGFRIIASGSGAHAEGSAQYKDKIASGIGSHAEGEGTVASGIRAHAEGAFTTSSGANSHSEGMSTIASGNYSHAQNHETIAASSCQTAIGKYNIEDANDDYAFIIGNGSGFGRSNALTVDWDGNIRANTETPTPSFTTTTGALKSYSCRRFGNVVQLRLTVNNSNAVVSGANIYEGTLNTTALRPQAVATGASYYGAHAIGGMLNTAGSITIRNASSSSVTISGDNTSTVSFTYIL